MPLALANYQKHAQEAVKTFWKSREHAIAAGATDQGERAGVTAGKNMDGFTALIIALVRANGLPEESIFQKRALLGLPGFFRPTKLWDLLVIHEKKLIAAIELKSQVDPSFGNNFNNRTEEAIGTALDLKTALRERALGDAPPPFIGWLMLVEDADASRRPVTDRSPHFALFPEFQGASYLKRYDILCRKLVQEQLYSAAAVITTPRTASNTGEFQNLSALTSLKAFVTSLAASIAAAVAREEKES